MTLLLGMLGNASVGAYKGYQSSQERNLQRKGIQKGATEQRRMTTADLINDLMDRKTEMEAMSAEEGINRRSRNSRALMQSAAQMRGALT
jgi:hypothetical protein